VSVAAAIFFVALAVYVVTLAPTVFLIDSGLLTVAAASRGSAHPPGFPLFLMLTHLATLLPAGNVAWRANLASAFFAALASAAAAIVVAEVLLGAAAKPRAGVKKGKRKDPPPPAAPSSPVIAAAMVAGGLLLAFSRTLWAYATVTEVYALNTFLICALLAMVLRWRRTRSARLLYGGAVLAGAALGVHYLTFGFALAGVLLLVVRSGGLTLLRSKNFAVAVALGAVAALAVYAYLPLAARGNPALNWGDPETAHNFIRHVTAKEYRSYITAEEGGDQAGDFRRYVVREFGPALFPAALLLALAGLGAAFRRDRALFWTWVVIGVATTAWFLVYPITDDGDAYLLPLFVVLATAAGSAVAAIARERVVLAWVLAAIPAVALLAHWKDRDRSDFRLGNTYAQDALRGIEEDAILFTNDGHLWGSLMYLREAEHVRPDVVTIHHGSLVRSWYLDQFVKREPRLAASVQRELAAYRPLVEVFENDEARWTADAQVREEFVNRFNDLILALIARQLERGAHVYATPDVALKDLGAGYRIMPQIRSSYDLLPGGLALHLRPLSGPQPIRSVPFELRGLDDPQMRRTGGKVVEMDIIPAYVTALRLRARYLAFSRRYDEARRSYDDALRLDPANAEIRTERERLPAR
jgi:tetratricopeptide (TPR) repeat protein